MRVLVTGATGRIGRHLVDRLLEHGHAVRALVMPDDPQRNRAVTQGIEIAEGHLGDRATLDAAVADVDAVYHLGALLPQGRSAEELFETNVRGTFNLLESLLPHAWRIKRFVFASTDNVYPDNQGLRYLPVDESHPRLNNDPYGISKIIGEDLCLGYMRRCGLPVAIARFGLTLAGRELLDPTGIRAPLYVLKPMLAQLQGLADPDSIDREAIRRLEAVNRDESTLVIARDLAGKVSVEMINDPQNVADGLLLFLDSRVATGEVFHIMAAHPFAYDAFVHHIADLTGWPVVEVTVSRTLHLNFSIAKARAMLGYDPVRDIFQMLDEGWGQIHTGGGTAVVNAG